MAEFGKTKTRTGEGQAEFLKVKTRTPDGQAEFLKAKVRAEEKGNAGNNKEE